MEKLNESVFLEQLILIKQAECDQQGKALKQYFHDTYESLRPINIIKSAFQKPVESSDLKAQVLNTSMGIATGFIARKLFVGSSGNPITKILGNILESFVASKTEKNAEGIRSIGSFLISKITDQHHSK